MNSHNQRNFVAEWTYICTYQSESGLFNEEKHDERMKADVRIKFQENGLLFDVDNK